MGNYVDEFNRKILTVDKANYHREQLRSFMTGPEWRNVEMAEEFAAYLKEGRSVFQFPYFGQVADLWKVVGKSYKAARKYNTRSEIWFSTDYMLMDLFVAFFTTLELIPKGILSLFIRPFLPKKNPTEMQGHLAAYFKKYADRLQAMPFYDHPYKQERKELSKLFWLSKNKTLGDYLSWIMISIDLRARHWISKPLHYWFHMESNAIPATTEVIVKFNADNVATADEAKQKFQQALGDVSIVKQDVYVKDKHPQKTYTSVYARLSVPRYAAFQNTVRQLGEENIAIRKIAGNDRVQVKCTTTDALKTAELPGELRYTYGDRIHGNKKFLMFDVPVKDLHRTLKQFDAKAKVEFIHNF